MDVEVPANTTATVFIPGNNESAITESGRQLNKMKGLDVKGVEEGYVVLNVGSGNYHFETTGSVAIK
jgi:alpha-L-rhamnosidase